MIVIGANVLVSPFDKETRAEVVRLVRDHGGDYESEWVAMKAIAARVGASAETLREWVGQSDVDAGQALGVPRESARDPGAQVQVRGAGAHDRGTQGGDEFFGREGEPLSR
ncbi:MAG: hypothetical protein ACRDTC_07210 [Pseudonocardiaceae bacterium]